MQPVCNIGLVDEARWAPWYGSISGTSMGSPHAAGAAALLLQARPDLTPAQVEDVLQDTAYKLTFGGGYVADPQNSGGTTSFDKGAGLIDLPAALDALGVAATARAAAEAEGLPTSGLRTRSTAAPSTERPRSRSPAQRRTGRPRRARPPSR